MTGTFGMTGPAMRRGTVTSRQLPSGADGGGGGAGATVGAAVTWVGTAIGSAGRGVPTGRAATTGPAGGASRSSCRKVVATMITKTPSTSAANTPIAAEIARGLDSPKWRPAISRGVGKRSARAAGGKLRGREGSRAARGTTGVGAGVPAGGGGVEAVNGGGVCDGDGSTLRRTGT